MAAPIASIPESLLTIEPTTTHTHTVVFLHGRGDNALSFAQSLYHSRPSANQTLFQTYPSFRWIFPTAPLLPLSSQPTTKVSQWFDIHSVLDFSINENLQADGLRFSVNTILAILTYEAARLGGQWDRIVLAGISQGAATSVHTLLHLDLDTLPMGMDVRGERHLAAFVGFSARMPFPGRNLEETRAVLGIRVGSEGDEVLRNTPMLLEDCVDDPLVKVENGRVLRDTLRAFGASVEWREYRDGGHWFNSPQGMDELVTFLNHYVCHIKG